MKRLRRACVVLVALLAVLAALWLSPVQPLLVKAVLLGPDSVVPQLLVSGDAQIGSICRADTAGAWHLALGLVPAAGVRWWLSW